MSRLLDTQDYESIYKSLAELLGMPDIEILSYALERTLEDDLDIMGTYYDERGHFFDWANGRVQNEDSLSIKNITIFHFARRLESIEDLKEMSLQNLREIVNSENKLTNFLKEHGVTFVSNNGYISCFYKDIKLDFSRKRNRLNEDSCINGYFFGGKIYNEGDIRGLRICPEFIQDIEEIIKEQILGEDSQFDLSYNYQQRSKAFIFKIRVPINALIFDGCGAENECDIIYNTVEVYKHIGSYLINKVLDKGIRNKVIRFKDDATVSIENVLEIFEVSDKELYRN